MKRGERERNGLSPSATWAPPLPGGARRGQSAAEPGRLLGSRGGGRLARGGSARCCRCRGGSVQPGTARHGSARLCTARLGCGKCRETAPEPPGGSEGGTGPAAGPGPAGQGGEGREGKRGPQAAPPAATGAPRSTGGPHRGWGGRKGGR